jgi:hypothetical protein
MEDHPTLPGIVEALRLRDGVVITFEDGRCAVYSAALLYATLPKTHELTEDLSDQE